MISSICTIKTEMMELKLIRSCDLFSFSSGCIYLDIACANEPKLMNLVLSHLLTELVELNLKTCSFFAMSSIHCLDNEFSPQEASMVSVSNRFLTNSLSVWALTNMKKLCHFFKYWQIWKDPQTNPFSIQEDIKNYVSRQ